MIATHHGSRAKQQRGQSLVEVCIACIALVPLAIGLTYVGQYVHIKQVVQQAARNAAWDAAVAPSAYQSSPTLEAGPEGTSLRVRYFGAADTVVDATPTAPPAFVDPLLTDYAGHALLDPGKLSLSTYTDDTSPGPEGAITSAIAEATSLIAKLPFVDGGKFPPDPKGYVTARVDATTNLSANFKPFDALDLDFHAQTVLLADAWNADGAGESDSVGGHTDTSSNSPIPSRTVRRSLPPSAALLDGSIGGVVSAIFNTIGSVPILDNFFPNGGGLDVGRAAPDVVPYDKLQPYNAKQ